MHCRRVERLLGIEELKKIFFPFILVQELACVRRELNLRLFFSLPVGAHGWEDLLEGVPDRRLFEGGLPPLRDLYQLRRPF